MNRRAHTPDERTFESGPVVVGTLDTGGVRVRAITGTPDYWRSGQSRKRDTASHARDVECCDGINQ